MPLDDKRLSVGPYKNVRTELAFGGKDQGSHCLTRRQAAQIVAELSVEVAKTVRAGDANARARAGKEKSSLPAKRTEAARSRRHNTSLAASEKQEPPLPLPPRRVRSIFPRLSFCGEDLFGKRVLLIGITVMLRDGGEVELAPTLLKS